ncbi:MAG TPA: polysaccharide deacetylase family protein [Solirubrobacteraceae bacterium]|nr:polysaccharide deacetylase family protein [Solirubrobacteraceae bacterium]
MRTASQATPSRPPDQSTQATRSRRHQLLKWAALSGFAVLGMCTVSIPLTVAVVLSTTGASDLITLGSIAPKRHHTTPAKAIADIRCVPTRGHYALTFDGGPMPATTPKLVAALIESRGVATFFDVGQRAAAHQDLVELQRSVGQVANHAFSAPRMTDVSQTRRYQELQAAAKALDYPNAFFRPPHGAINSAVEADVRRSGLTPVYWTVDASHPALSTSEIVDRALRVQPGGIVRLADGQQTVEAIPEIVARQRARGMCPGLISTTKQDVVGANGRVFNAVAVKP